MYSTFNHWKIFKCDELKDRTKNQLNFDSWAEILWRPWSLRNKTFTKCTSSNIHCLKEFAFSCLEKPLYVLPSGITSKVPPAVHLCVLKHSSLVFSHVFPSPNFAHVKALQHLHRFQIELDCFLQNALPVIKNMKEWQGLIKITHLGSCGCWLTVSTIVSISGVKIQKLYHLCYYNALVCRLLLS